MISDFGIQRLLAAWEALADQCDDTALQLEDAQKRLVCSYREKARAFRKCAEDLKKQLNHEQIKQ